MEFILLVAVVFSAATNIYLSKKVVTTVNVTVQPSEVNPDFAVEIPEPMVLVNIPDIDYDRLEAMVQRIVAASQVEQIVHPTWVQPPPNFVPTNHPIISQTPTNISEIEVDGVKGRQFPAK